MSASNPSGPPFTSQAIAKIVGIPRKVTEVTEVIAGDATAYNVVTGEDETLAISDLLTYPARRNSLKKNIAWLCASPASAIFSG